MQLTFGSVRYPQADNAWSRLVDALEAAIALITPKELCYRLNIKPSYLSDAIEGRDRKGLKAEWIPVILDMAPDQARQAILRELAAPLGYDVVRRKDLTPEERLAQLEEKVAREFGAAGARLVQEGRR